MHLDQFGRAALRSVRTSGLACVGTALGLAVVHADDPPATPQPQAPAFVLQSVEDKYQSEATKADALVTKAEGEASKLKKAAADIRLKAYKDRLVEVTKTGDFEKASAVKARIEQLEKDPEAQVATSDKTKRPRPKDTVKFGGHTYALIKEPATWHVAKQRCEEMGGHLVMIETPQEEAFTVKLCESMVAWVGASDEDTEGAFRWIDGSMVQLSALECDNYRGVQNHIAYYPPNKRFEDFESDGRLRYVCEWSR
jgi:hypothetical protein